MQWVMGFIPGIIDHSPACSARVKMSGAVLCLSLYALMGWAETTLPLTFQESHLCLQS
jgi:hypothetical protein